MVLSFFRSFGCHDLIHLGEDIRKPLAKMRHHGMMEWRLHLKAREPNEVLHIWILTDRLDCFPIRQLHPFLDDQRTQALAQTDRLLAAKRVYKMRTVFLFCFCPRNQLRKLNPTILIV